MDGIRSEYDIIRSMNGLTYKLLNVIRIMVKEGHADSDGYVSLSHKKISMKLGVGNNVTRILNDLENYPDVVEIKRGNSVTSTPNKFKLNEHFLL